VHQGIAGHRLVRPQERDGQQRPLLAAADIDHSPVRADLKRPKDAVVDHRSRLAGIAALGVAFFHAAPQNATLDQLRLANVHLTCAAALFILLGAISLLIFPKDMSEDEKRKQKWRVPCYRGLGAVIWLSIILMPTLNTLAGSF
jgi:hypothetical protein